MQYTYTGLTKMFSFVLSAVQFQSNIELKLQWQVPKVSERWFKRPCYSCAYTQATSTTSESMLMNTDLKTHFRFTDLESFTKSSHVIHLYTKIWMGVFFLSYTIESSGKHYSKRCLRHSHSDNLNNFEGNNQVT